MTIDDEIGDEKLQYDINVIIINMNIINMIIEKLHIYPFYHLVKLININISMVKKYHLLIKVEL